MNASYKHNITLLFLILASLPAFSQFRMIGTASWTVVTDSTYSGTINFQVDLTGKGYLATSVVDTFRVFTGTEQIYTITTVGTKTFSSAQVTIKEYNGDHGIPIGQVMVYDPAGKTTLPQAPFGSTGSTAQLQAAVDTYNARLLSSISSLADGDKGDITVSASGASWTIDNNTITGDKISASAVGADEIASGAVGPDELAPTSVTPGVYTAANLTIDQDGRIESATDGETLYNGGTFSLGSTHELLETALGAYSTRFRNSAGGYMGIYSDTTDGDFLGLKWVTLRGTFEMGETLSEFRMKFANDTRFELSNSLDRYYLEGTFDTDDTNTAALAVDPVTYELELVSIPENQIIDTLSYDNTTGILSASLSSDGVPANAVSIPNIGNSNLTLATDRTLSASGNTFAISGAGSSNAGYLSLGDATSDFGISSTNLAVVRAQSSGVGLLYLNSSFVAGESAVTADSSYTSYSPNSFIKNGAISVSSNGIGIKMDSISGADLYYRLPFTNPPVNRVLGNLSGDNELEFSLIGDFQVTNPLGGDNKLQATIDSLNANLGGGGGASQLSDLSDVVSATNTNRFALMANGTTGYVGRALVQADVSDLNLTSREIALGTGSGITSESGFKLRENGVLELSADNGTGNVGISSVGGAAMGNIDALSDFNVAIGFGAMAAALNNADNNVALGPGALFSLTTGDKNTGAGPYAGADLTTGSDNFFGGYFAGDNATVLGQSVNVGSYAGYLVTSSNGGIGGTKLGYYAGGGSISDYLVSVGHNSGTSGSNTNYLDRAVAVGALAGSNLGVNNARSIFMGFSAGNGESTYDDLILIGSEASATQSNQIVIGHESPGYESTQLKVRNYKFNVDQTLSASNEGDRLVYNSTTDEFEAQGPQYAQSYNEGGENSSITAGTPEQIVSTTIGTTDTIVTTSEFLVQADADIQYNGSDNAVVKITAEAAIDISTAAYVLYYIAINGTVQPSSKFRVYSAGTGSIPMSVNITYIDSDADNGDVYSLYAESTTGTVGYTVATLRMLAEKIK